MRKWAGGLTLALLIVWYFVDRVSGLPILFITMACFVFAAWHQVLYMKGKRDRTVAA
jgi:hypothetical protein